MHCVGVISGKPVYLTEKLVIMLICFMGRMDLIEFCERLNFGFVVMAIVQLYCHFTAV